MNIAHDGERAVLRRMDWRFLLPRPPEGSFEHLVLLGGPAEVARRLIETGVARQVSRNVPESSCADALIFLHDAQVDLNQALGCLMPGGVFYGETDRRLPSCLTSTPARTTRALRAAGLLPLGVYAVKPNFNACELYLPLRPRGALSWYVSSLYTAATPVGRLFETALKTVTRLEARRFAPLSPCYAVIAVAAATEADVSHLPGHLRLARSVCSESFENADTIMLTDGSSRVVLLPFAADGTDPCVVLKIPRLKRFNDKIETEQRTLTELGSRLDPAMRATVPRALGVLPYGELAVGMETFCQGRSLLTTTARWGMARAQKMDDLRLAAKWLGDFHQQTQVSNLPWDATAKSRWIDDILLAYTQRFGLTDEEERLFAAVRHSAVSLFGTRLPIVWQHRDFNVWNIFRHGSEVKVIDWEGGRTGLPLCDLLHLVTQWHEVARGLRDETSQIRAFGQLFFEARPGSALAHTIHQVISEYLGRLGIDSAFMPILLVATWVELALRRFDQQKALADSGVDPRSNNRHIAFVEVLASHVTQLCSGATTGVRAEASAAV